MRPPPEPLVLAIAPVLLAVAGCCCHDGAAAAAFMVGFVEAVP